ncbi:MAG: hypothetical protein WCP96_00780 [Methylococcaceae bacterium]
MKQFNKTLIAIALLAGTGAANASIATGASAEAFMQVYDKTQGLTYSLDLGPQANLTALSNSVANHLVLNYDLGKDLKWTNFMANLDTANTKFGIVVGFGIKSLYTSSTASVWNATTRIVTSGLTTTSGQVTAGSNADALAAARINIGVLPVNTALNVSKVVADTATAGTGQWASTASGVNNLDNLWGSYAGAHAAVAFGNEANFFLTSGKDVKELGQWTLTGNNLSFTTVPATVPLPAAVWLFGTGLMGVLRLNRRKSMAV